MSKKLSDEERRRRLALVVRAEQTAFTAAMAAVMPDVIAARDDISEASKQETRIYAACWQALAEAAMRELFAAIAASGRRRPPRGRAAVRRWAGVDEDTRERAFREAMDRQAGEDSPDTAKRLALAAMAQCAAIRAEQAEERSALLLGRVRPFEEALERFEKMYRRECDLSVPGDGALLRPILAATGGADIGPDDFKASADALRDIGQCHQRAAEAHRAIAQAMRDDGAAEDATTLEWVGVDAETYERALDRALGEA